MLKHMLLVTIYTVTHIALQTNKNNDFSSLTVMVYGLFITSLASWFRYDK